uniref:Uncharacterized protein LOC101501454 n=1 Tax=Cicer arietinum TaxID=3827 RepID=A0A1S3EGC4_CICAR|nr:uncharacterized protein LOC101501454 [Cicer arietinum]
MVAKDTFDKTVTTLYQVSEIEHEPQNLCKLQWQKGQPLAMVTLPNLGIENRPNVLSQSKVNANTIYEWNIDDKAIAELLIAGFSGQLKEWWDYHLMPPQHLEILNAIQTTEEGIPIIDEIGNPIPDATNLNGIPPSHSDLFLHIHKCGKDKTWVDKRSEYVHEKFKRRFEELTQETTSQGTPPPNELDVWCEVAGIKRGRVYGLGMESTVLLGRPNYRGSCSSSTEWVQRHEFEEMRNERDQLREELANTNRAVERNNYLIKQLMNSLNFKPMPYTTDQIHEDGVSDNDNEIGDHDAGDFDDEIADNDARDHDGEELDG